MDCGKKRKGNEESKNKDKIIVIKLKILDEKGGKKTKSVC
jgi:hypothetical protein